MTITIVSFPLLQKTPTPPPPPPTPPREVENQYVQVEFEPEPPVIQEPAPPIIEEHIFRQTTTKRIIENNDEATSYTIKDTPRYNIRIPSRSPGNRRRILREFRPVAYT